MWAGVTCPDSVLTVASYPAWMRVKSRHKVLPILVVIKSRGSVTVCAMLEGEGGKELDPCT